MKANGFPGSIVRRVFSLALASRTFRKLLYDAHPADTLLLADCGKERYLVNSSDRIIGRFCYSRRKSFDAGKLAEAFRLLPSHGSRRVLVDIGGNIGTISISAVVHGWVDRCVTFEPEPGNFRLLQSNILLNGVGDRITAHCIALSDGSASSLEFELSDDNFGDHRVRAGSAAGLFGEERRRTIVVPARKLDDFVDGIDLDAALIWMDTQGFEGFVLSGARAFLDHGVPMVVEFWPYGMQRVGGLEPFLSAVTSGRYSTVIDLEKPHQKLACTRESLLHLTDAVGTRGRFTDLLIY
jgi:FkbM family methyltransferase